MNTLKNILVCVTQQKTCERLIRKAAMLRDELKSNLFVIHVIKSDWNFLGNEKEGEALEYLFSISKSVGADLSVLKSDNIVDTIVEFVIKNDINCIIMGEPTNNLKENNFYYELKNLLKNVEIQVIPPE